MCQTSTGSKVLFASLWRRQRASVRGSALGEKRRTQDRGGPVRWAGQGDVHGRCRGEQRARRREWGGLRGRGVSGLRCHWRGLPGRWDQGSESQAVAFTLEIGSLEQAPGVEAVSLFCLARADISRH